MTRDLFWS